MKTILILNDEKYYLPGFLDEFLNNTKHEITHIFTVDFFPPQANKKTYTKASMAIMPTRFLLLYILKTSFYALLSILPLPSRFKRLCSIAHTCRHYSIPHKKILDVNDPLFLEWIKSERIEAALSICSQIYRLPILSIDHLKLYNFHPSLLPRNKGRFPVFWAFMRHDPQGMTCHRIVEKIDAGEILCQTVVETSTKDDVATVLNKITKLSPSFFEEAFDRIMQNNPQKNLIPGDSFYGPTPSMDEIKTYHRIIHDRRSKV